ncbi:MAG: hypothetical protein Q9227_007207 [Pyrenula ochraceoflavens]
MAVQILSDLHLEAPKAYDIFRIVPKAPYLALLGDIGNIASHKDDCLTFLTKQLRRFRAVLFVPGNHEAYESSWPETLDILRTFEENVRKDSKLGDFVLLDRAVFQPPDSNIVILGCSLFSSVPSGDAMRVSMGLNDFWQTDDWDVEKHNEAHKRDLAWLNAQVAELEQSNVKVMILSHWSPSRDTHAVVAKHAESPITTAFSTDLSKEACFKSDKVKVWAFGHTHYNCDFMVERGDAGPLRLVTNQRGYYHAQSAAFDCTKAVEID